MSEDTIYEWEKEVENLSVSDLRLKKRLVKIPDALSTSPEQSIFLASGDSRRYPSGPSASAISHKGNTE